MAEIRVTVTRHELVSEEVIHLVASSFLGWLDDINSSITFPDTYIDSSMEDIADLYLQHIKEERGGRLR